MLKGYRQVINNIYFSDFLTSSKIKKAFEAVSEIAFGSLNR